MPSPTLQNMKTVSMGSFMAVRKRIIESAPTMPMLSARLLFISISISDVTMVSTIRLRLKLREYITPPKVLL